MPILPGNSNNKNSFHRVFLFVYPLKFRLRFFRFHELQMQVQAYNPEKAFNTLQQILEANPKAASLHYKVGFAIGLYISELNGIVPHIADVEEKKCIPFQDYVFQLEASETGNIKSHRISIAYYSKEMWYFGQAGQHLLVSIPGSSAENPGWVSTTLLPLQPGINITGIQWDKETTSTSHGEIASSVVPPSSQ